MTLFDAAATREVGVAGAPIRTTFWRAASKPMAVAGLAAGAVVTVGLRDPHASGNYPSCPSIVLFGVHCPGCGSMRAVHHLSHGDIGGVLARNILLPIGLVLLAWAWVAWFDRRLGRSRVPALRPPVPALYGSVVVLVAFAILRNLPWAPFSGLAP
jgi:hypothetical protein